MNSTIKKFDVLIIGSGPAGLMTASILNRDTSLKVGILSPKLKKFYDVKGTAYQDLVNFGLEGCIETTQTKLGMYSESQQKVFDFKKDKMCVINFFKLLTILTSRTKKSTFIEGRILDVKRQAGG